MKVWATIKTKLRQALCEHFSRETSHTLIREGDSVMVLTKTVCLECGKTVPSHRPNLDREVALDLLYEEERRQHIQRSPFNKGGWGELC